MAPCWPMVASGAWRQAGPAELTIAPTVQMQPKVLGYLRYLQESKIVWNFVEETVANSDDPTCAPPLYLPLYTYLQSAVTDVCCRQVYACVYRHPAGSMTLQLL